MKKAIFIVGPTAVGKTALAISLSKHISSTLISADSIQVYRGADIISGKDHPQDVKIELIDILSAIESFNVRDFVDSVRRLNNKTNKILIIVGGTGLYTKSLFENIETINIPPDEKLREELSSKTIKQLQDKLKELNPKRFKKMNNSDANNPRRLIRAIEIDLVQGSTLNKVEPLFTEEEVLVIGLKTSAEDLRKRIEVRVKNRIEKGALGEAKKLFQDYDNLSPQLKVANGYRQVFEFLQAGSFTPEVNVSPPPGWDDMVEQWITADYQHAKAQMTYFKKMDVEWFDIRQKEFEGKIMELVKKYFHG